MSSSTELADEQAYLDHARAQLARMRDKAESMEAIGGDKVSTEFLAKALFERAQSLADDGRTALIFGRISVDADHPAAGAQPASWRIGRRHVTEANGTAVVLDWRARVSQAFYQATRDDPQHVTLRRRYGFNDGTISALEDEHLTDVNETDRTSEILAAEIERPRVGPMRDIVSTIQPEQDELVRQSLSQTVCIQGAPGTGKTAVGLHRAAWLLFTFRSELASSGVLVIGPNRAFLEHVGAVLPTLGEMDVHHCTISELVAGVSPVKVRGTDTTDVATLKGDARMAGVLRRAVWAHVQTPTEPVKVPRGVRTWTVSRYDVQDTVAALVGRGLPYEASRELFPQRIAALVMEQINASGDYPDGRVQDTIAKSRPVQAYAKSLWPQVKPVQVLHRLFSDAAFLADVAGGDLTAEEQESLVWDKPAKTAGAVRWSPADAVLLDELAGIMARPDTVGHVILDEAQDLSAMQLRAVARRCPVGSATVLGDMAQGTTPWSTSSWSTTLAHLNKPDGKVTELTLGFRVPEEIINYAARLLPHISEGLTPPQSVRKAPQALSIAEVSSLLPSVVEQVQAASAEPGSVGVIVADDSADAVSDALDSAGVDHGVLGADAGDVDHQIDVVPASVAKGLEFDAVVVVEPSAIVSAEPDRRTGLRRLYVVLTRAVSRLCVVHSQPLPAALDM